MFRAYNNGKPSVARGRRSRWPLCLLLIALGTGHESRAHLPEYFGRKYVQVIDALTPPAAACESADRDARKTADALKDRLDDAVLDAGAYSPSLADPIGELGKLYSTLCNHPAALKANRDALQIVRVNEGLLSPAQIPYLRALADDYQAIGDFASAQQSLRSVFRVHGMGRGKLNDAALRDSLAYFARARAIFIDPRSRGELSLFFEAFNDNEDMLEAQLERDDLAYATREALSVSHLRNLYLLLGTDFAVTSSLSADAASPAADFLQRSQMLTYGKGRVLLEELIEEAQNEPPLTRARLYLRLGNWQQWNAKWGQACDSYALAWEFATGKGSEALRKQLARPALLPEDTGLWASLLNPDIAVKASIVAGFRVSARGDISRVDAVIEDEGSSGLAGRVARWLRDSHARPGIADGACAAGELRGQRLRLLD
ncbi:hypothetical protein [Congregibacter litoralis]|uniref:Tetratricopeptide repeat protein n=1 Tax=Congregibacter litoralis KT71 TaxID=314285 RepID=A4A7E7_9GAMM|nr:hypothetical protein [Congregibacter litoralis]EAQ98216.2 hypothetical protein KT71_03177 [Congregibacter litoralis KT71]